MYLRGANISQFLADYHRKVSKKGKSKQGKIPDAWDFGQ